MAEVIRFYRQHDPWGDFSNFSAHPIELDGYRWRTSEHYFQAQKFADPALQLQIRESETPGDTELIEHTTNDSYWADGGDGSGKNRLGVLLMQLRDELRDEAPSD